MNLVAGGDLILTASVVENEYHDGSKKHSVDYYARTSYGGTVWSDGDMSLYAGNDLRVEGSAVIAMGDASLIAGNNITVTSVMDEMQLDQAGKKGNFLKQKSWTSSDHTETNVSSLVMAGGNLTVAAAGDVNIHASDLIAGKDMLVAAGAGENGRADASVTITAGQDFESHGRSQSKSGLFGGGGGWADIWHKKTITTVDTDITNVGSSLSAGGDLTITAKSDINIQGSSVSAGGTAALDAGRDINITPGYDGTSDYYKKTEKGIGIRFSAGHGSAQAQAGYHSEKTTLTLDTASVVPSFIQGGAGVVMNAGNDINLQAAVITSPGDITLSAGHDINATVAYDTMASTAKHEQLFVGVSAKVTQNVTGIISSLQQSAKIINSGHGGAAYEAIGMASGVLKARDAIATASGGLRVSGSVMFGAEGSKTSTHEEMAIARGTILDAGGNLTLSAGNDVHLIGTQAHAGNDLSITAGRDVIIESAQSYSSSGSKEESWNAGIGVSGSFGANGPSWGIQIEGGYANSKNDSWSIQQENSYITAGNSVTIKSGNDTTIAGAIIYAPEVTLDVGHDLTIQSRQDTAHSDGSAVRGGGSLTIGMGSPSSVSGYVGGGQSDSDVAWVRQQTGIYADGKLDITVGNHTQIDGAVVNSSNRDLTLDTGTLGFSTIKDHDRGSAFDVTVSGSYSTSEDKRNPQTGGKNNVSVGGMIENHDREQDTNATVGGGIINVWDHENQKQDVAALNRDLDKAQVITKDESHGTQFYGSSDSIKSAMKGFKDVPDDIIAAVENTAKTLDLAGKTVVAAVDMIADALGAKGGLTPEEVEQAKQKAKEAAKDPQKAKELAEQIASCGSSQQGFNFNILEFFVTTAHAEAIAISGGGSCKSAQTAGAILKRILAGTVGAIETGAVVSAATVSALAGAFFFAMTGSAGGMAETKYTAEDGTQVTIQGDSTLAKTIMITTPTGETYILTGSSIVGGIGISSGTYVGSDGSRRGLTAGELSDFITGAGSVGGMQISLASKSGPKDAPSGTRPIDKWGIATGPIHEVKKELGLGATDWVGVTKNGDVITVGPNGEAQNEGHINNIIKKPANNLQPSWRFEM